MIISEELTAELINQLGKNIIEYKNLHISVCKKWIALETKDRIVKEWRGLKKLTDNQKKLLIDLVSENINSTNNELFKQFYENSEWMKIMIFQQDKEYDLLKIAEEHGMKIDNQMIKNWLDLYSTNKIN